MVTSVSVNPLVTTNAAGSFQIASVGLIQGTAMADPASRFQLAGGILAATETLPMWGGVGISEAIGGVAGQAAPELGSVITRASTLAVGAAGQLAGFSVFDQNHAMLTTPQSPVPLMPSGGEVNFYRFGCGIRVALALDPALVTLEGGSVWQNISWDFNIQQLVQGQAAFAANVLTASSWAATNGGQATFTTTSAHGVAVGTHFSIAGETPAGYNGDYIAIAGTAGSTLVGALAVNPGASTVQGTLVAGGGLLSAFGAVVVDIEIGNSMTVNQPDVNGNISWNRAGSAAVVLLG